MMKKAGLVVAGVAVAFVAAAPFAFATDEGHEPPAPRDEVATCAFDGGSAAAQSLISGDSAANAVAQAPVAGNNLANIGNCSQFLNDNLSHNTVEVNVLAPTAPEVPVEVPVEDAPVD